MGLSSRFGDELIYHVIETQHRVGFAATSHDDYPCVNYTESVYVSYASTATLNGVTDEHSRPIAFGYSSSLSRRPTPNRPTDLRHKST